MMTLTSFLIFKGSAESKDSDEEMQTALDRIERRLDELASTRGRNNVRATAGDRVPAGLSATGD